MNYRAIWLQRFFFSLIHSIHTLPKKSYNEPVNANSINPWISELKIETLLKIQVNINFNFSELKKKKTSTKQNPQNEHFPHIQDEKRFCLNFSVIMFNLPMPLFLINFHFLQMNFCVTHDRIFVKLSHFNQCSNKSEEERGIGSGWMYQ